MDIDFNMNTEEILFDNLLDTSVDGNVFLEDLIEDPAANVLEQAMKENMMEVWESSDYELLNSPIAGELKFDDITQSTNYLEWINWDQKEKTDNIIPASNSSDSGLSSDFHYDQQLSPSNEMDRSTPTGSPTGGGGGGSSICSSVDVDSVSSPDTLCPSSPCSDIHLIDDAADIEINSSKSISSPAIPPKPTSSPLVFPVSLKDLNLREIKAVKIIRNGSTLVSSAASAVLGGIKSTSAQVPDAIKKLLGPVQLSVSSAPTSSSTKTSYPPILLSDEERRLLAKEGVELPSHYPLTKHEERELKRIRRKIRNKISAQDSRKRKRVYMDGLEDRVKLCSDENMSLQKRIRLLETENKSLLSQLKRLQSILTGQGGNQASPTVAAITAASTTAGTNTNTNSKEGLSSTSNTAQPATCLLVLMLSFALFLLPNLRPDSNKSLTDGRTNSAASQMAQSMMKMPPFAGRSRALLQDTLALDADSDMTDIELLEIALGGEVVVGEEDEEDESGLYVPLPLGPLAMPGGKNDVLKSQWGQKFGKQYPANPKRSVPAFLLEHDYHSADPTAKRARFKEIWEEVETIVSPAPISNVYSGATKESNQSQLYGELAELARGQNIVVRISSEEL